MKTVCRIVRLGLIDYEEAWQMQDRLAREIAAGEREPSLLLLEHPHTYTFGRSGRRENLLWDQAELDRRNVQVHWVDRGGDVTYHGPGQLVGYPLLPLGRPGIQVDEGRDASRLPQADYVGYLRSLESVLISAVAHLGIVSGQIPGLTGVWVQPEVFSRCKDCPPDLKRLPAKIAAIGVKVDSRGISRHGFALNVNPDMTYWNGIVGCGLEDYPVASLAQLLDPSPRMEEVIDRIVAAFSENFGYEMIPTSR